MEHKKSTKTIFNIDFNYWNSDEEVLDLVKQILRMRQEGLEQELTFTGTPITQTTFTQVVLSFHDCETELDFYNYPDQDGEFIPTDDKPTENPNLE